MRKRRRWAENLADWGITMLVVSIACLVAIIVHDNASQWEAPAIFVSLGLGLVPAVWYFRTKRFGWLAGILSGVLFAFSFAAALLHGWRAPVFAVINVGALIFTAVMFAFLIRIWRRGEFARCALVEELKEEARFHGNVLFRDDGERITVYPNRRRLLLQGAVQALVLAALGGVYAFIKISNILVLCVLWLFTGLLVAVFFAILYRLVVRRPTLVVGPDGIFDNGSLIATGAGLLRWDEILDLREYSTSAGAATNRYLGIVVTDRRAIRKRQPLWKRIALRLFAWPPSQFSIWQGILSVPVHDLAGQIDRYVETHAPPGWRDEQDNDESALPPAQESSAADL